MNAIQIPHAEPGPTLRTAVVAVSLTSPISSSVPQDSPKAVAEVPVILRSDKKLRKEIELLSSHATEVISDVRGNLGPATVVISESTADWLKDRWQAARNMRGEPIPGEHYIQMRLQGPSQLLYFIIDWETACSDHYSILGSNSSAGPFIPLAQSTNRVIASQSHQHVIHRIESQLQIPVIYVKLMIKRGATAWGVSVWRFQVYGYRVSV